MLLNGSGLFHRYIATSPAVVLDGQTLLDLQADGLPAGSALPARVFVSVGSMDTAFRPHIEAFNAEMHAGDYRGLHFDTAELSGYGHSSAGPAGLLSGLRSVFPKDSW